MKTRAKDMIFDFCQYLFLLAVSIFFFFYFILGDRMELARKIVQAFMFLSIFGALFVIKFKLNDQKRKKLKKEQRLNEIIAYLTEKDKLKDLIVVSFLPILVYGIALINGFTRPGDFFQAMAVFFIGLIWHYFLFKKRDNIINLMYVTNHYIIVDSILVFSLPIVVIAFSFIDGGADIIDIIQAVVVFILVYYWHKFLFRKKKN